MLATAREPKWIAVLALALVMATVFVVLSAWQFGESRSEGNPIAGETETPVEFTEVFEPGQPMTIYEADRIVNVSGEFIQGSQFAIDSRLQDGEEGYWVVTAFRVDGAPAEEVIPVVRGWVADLDEVDIPPTGSVDLQGRLLPPEAPGPGPRDLPPGVLPTLSVAELINLWGQDSYSGFMVDFSEAAREADSALQGVWVDPQPEPSEINWLNLFYGIEWVVFAGFAFYIWYRLVKDAHEKKLEEERLDREWEAQWRAEQLAKLQEAQEDNG